MRWYIGKTISKISELGSVDDDFLVRASESIQKKFRLVNYHSNKAKTSLYTSIPDNDWKAVNLASAYLGSMATWSSLSDEEIDNAVKNVFESEAHIESFASQLHSIADNLSVLVYWAIPYIQNKIGDQSKVSIYKVRDSLESHHSELRKEILYLTEMYEYQYLVAFTNLGKHQSLVDRSFLCNFETSEEHPHQVVFKSFVYKQKAYESIKAFDFTDSYGRKIKEQYLRIGASLERELSNG
ncbi:hypothetical protein D0856_04795 [Vibrio owensii]|uniref:hypothetical protein n=1 Tax=Vibrio owensii TaxID=696485 RepID=UPI000EFD308D|nr:hypothetical protein [Vibrio owensii]AYO19515.1 hypothetical protein D0856_04795 [Vibrio owensii]